MSTTEREELQALTVWLQTFPQCEQWAAQKNKENSRPNVDNFLQDRSLSSVIFEVASEICVLQDGAESTIALSGDPWDAVMCMTQHTTTGSKHKRMSLEPPPSDTPHIWDDYVKHAALANLLDGAVSHEDLHLRKTYIERIMKLPSDTQRALMGLIERRKKKSKTPRKSAIGGSSEGIDSTPNRSRQSPKAQNYPYINQRATPLQNQRPANGENHGLQSPFSPLVENLDKQQSASKRKSIISKGRSLTANKTPRRTFDQNFASPCPTLDYSPAKRGSSRPSDVAPTDASLFSPGLGDSNEYERQMNVLKDRNSILERQLAKMSLKEESLAKQLEQSAASFRKEMMQIEATAQRRQEEMQKHYEEELRTCREDLENVQQRYLEASRAKEELAGVKDEMDLLVHTKSQLADANERLQTYKEKLQQLTDVKEALTREEEAHSKAVEDCLRLENELKALQPLKRQLEEYKSRAVDSEVKLAECLDELTKLKQNEITSSDSYSGLEQAVQSQKEEIEELRSRIQYDSAGNVESRAIGDGLSELNPQLKEEMFRLRNENKQLRAFAAKREDDAVATLEQKCDDAVRLGERYKQQFLSTKNQLENTEKSLQESRDRESKLRIDVQQAMTKIQATQGIVDEVSQELYQCQENLKMSRSSEFKLENELAKWVNQAKDTQEKANDLSVQLQARLNELDASKRRELQLTQELSDWQNESQTLQERTASLEEKLSECETSLQQSHTRETEIQQQLETWRTKANSFENQAKRILADLNQCKSHLRESRTAEAQLTTKVAQLSTALENSKSSNEDLTAQLEKLTCEVTELNEALIESQKREQVLQNDLADMSTRAEDSESISRQRMELVQNTREKLKASKSEVERLMESQSSLSEQLKMKTKKIEVSEAKAEQLQNDLSDTIRELQTAKKESVENASEVKTLKESLHIQSNQLVEWRTKAESSEALTERLQEELVKMREILSDTQATLHLTQSDKDNMEEGVTQAEHLIFELEEAVEAESHARQQIETDFAAIQTSLSDTKDDLEETKARLVARINAETEQNNKLKQELFHAQETLTALQGSLGASQQREKMLSLEISKLQGDLEREAEASKKNLEAANLESARALDATREVLNAKARKETSEIQSNMNQLLEDERRAKRTSDENYKRQIQKLRQEFNNQLESLETTSKLHLKESEESHAEHVKQLKQSYETKMKDLQRAADDANEKLVAKGKNMLKELRNKAKEEHETLRAKFEGLEEQLRQEKLEKERIIAQAKTKLGEYKKKLQFATNRMSTLSAESDDLEEKVKNLEREKFKLDEENDRYRRQIGGRGGPDSKLQGQLELLQKEFQSAMEEARELRKQLREKESWSNTGRLGALPSISEDLDRSYSRDSVNQSTLVQLRSEYEETIEALNDEKRELVMKNSAAITDVQKAERRAWESEKENSTLKQQVTSLQLQVERLEHLLTNIDEPNAPGSSKENYFQVNANMSELSSIPPGISDDIDASSERDTKQETRELSREVQIYEANNRERSIVLRASQAHSNLMSEQSMDHLVVKSPTQSTNTERESDNLPSFVELHASSGQDAPPECKQC